MILQISFILLIAVNLNCSISVKSKKMKNIINVLFIASFLFGIECTPKKTEPINIEELTISDIHKAYKEGRYTSVQLVETYLNRIEQFDSITNAVTYINQDALKIAEELDKEFQRTHVLRPLHGIPLIVRASEPQIP